MATKTITVTEEAYISLANEKKKDESFSELINRKFTKKRSIMEFAGTWSDMGEEEANRLHKHIEDIRKRAGKLRRKELMKHLLS